MPDPTAAEQASTALLLAAVRLRDVEGPPQLRAYRKAHHGRPRGFVFTPSPRLLELCTAAADVLGGTISPDEAMNLLWRRDSFTPA